MNSPNTSFPAAPFAAAAPFPGSSVSSADSAGALLDRIAYAGLCAFVFVLPWEEAVPLYGGIVLSKWLGLFAISAALLRSGSLARWRPLRELHYWLIAFAAWSGATIFWSVDWDSTATRIATYTQLLVVVWLVWTLVRNEGRVYGLLFSYLVGTFVSSIGTILNLLAGRTTGQLDELEGPQATDSGRYAMNGMNPNDLGLLLALSLPMTLYLLSRKKNSAAITALCWIQFGLAVATLMLSGSRGAMFAASATLLILPFTVVRMPAWQKALGGAVSAGAIAFGIYMVPPETWQRFFDVGMDMTEGTMTHRTQIWAASMDLFRDHAFLGVGSGAHPVAVFHILARALVAHNTFISVLVETGVVGALIFAGLLAAALLVALRMGGLNRLFWLATLMAWTIGVCGGTWEYHKVTWVLLGLLVAHAHARPAVRIRRGNAFQNF